MSALTGIQAQEHAQADYGLLERWDSKLPKSCFGEKLMFAVNGNPVPMEHWGLRRRYRAVSREVIAAYQRQDKQWLVLLGQEIDDLHHAMSTSDPDPFATILQEQATRLRLPPHQSRLTFTVNPGSYPKSRSLALYEWATPRNLDIALLLGRQ
jgi:hypothetical protein